ncbi:hypothetical protein WOLCODRAFT_150995 [Wolfiporia cocos MD-104 SS10]|uniref:Uncharacterized protein n=1 Tax=Wolfiporia cocos (strain MD-104) TaxID=742152 RepID=A0A2H3JFG9_WOLCO|nr:hypothetical protein WOLCODRAFT_150995 [Wolfiporia cocos MD-104 SS10]
MQRFDADLPNQLIQLLPEAYRRIFYEEKHEWRDPPAGFFMKGGYLTILTPDRIAPTWVQVPPSSNDPWDQTRAAFERFGTMDNNREDRRTPPEEPWVWQVQPWAAVLLREAEARARAQGEWPITLHRLIICSLTLLSEQTPPEQECLEEEAFLEGEVPRAVEAIPRVAEAIQQVVREVIQEDCQVEEACQVEEDHRVAEARQEAQQEEAPTTHNQPEGTT